MTTRRILSIGAVGATRRTGMMAFRSGVIPLRPRQARRRPRGAPAPGQHRLA